MIRFLDEGFVLGVPRVVVLDGLRDAIGSCC